MNLRLLWITLVVTGVLPLAAQDPVTMSLPESGSVVLSARKDADRMTYELALQGKGEGVVFWKHAVPATAGPPMEWSNLLACDEKDGKIAALLELNEVSVMFVRYDVGKNETTESRIAAGRLLQKARFNAGTFKMEAPDKLVLTGEKGDKQAFFIKDGQILDDEGKPVENTGIKLGSETNNAIASDAKLIGQSEFNTVADPKAAALEMNGTKSLETELTSQPPQGSPAVGQTVSANELGAKAADRVGSQNIEKERSWLPIAMVGLVAAVLLVFVMKKRDNSNERID